MRVQGREEIIATAGHILRAEQFGTVAPSAHDDWLELDNNHPSEPIDSADAWDEDLQELRKRLNEGGKASPRGKIKK